MDSGKTAEIAGQYLRKGSLIYIEGRLHTRKYTDKQGIERYATDIIGETLQFLDSKKSAGESNVRSTNVRKAPADDADVPF